jgi:hypothetical protein
MSRLFYSRYWRPLEVFVVSLALIIFGGTTLALASLFSFIQNIFIRYAVATVSVQTAILSVLSLGLIIGKHFLIRRFRRRRERVDHLRDLFAQFTAGQEPVAALLKEAADHPGIFLEVAEESLLALKGTPRRRLEELLVQSSAGAMLHRLAADRNPNRALRAVSLLSKVHNPNSIVIIESALSHPAPIVQMAARVAALQSRNELIQWKVLEELPQLAFWQRVVLFQQIPDDSAVLLRFLSQALQSEEDEMVLAGLEFILSRQRLVPLSDSHRLADSSNAEIRIKFFKSLPFFPADDQTLHLLKSGLIDPDWRVRAMAARACGLLRVSGLTDELLVIVKSSRIAAETGHAARALVAIGGEAIHQLQALATSGSEMAHRIITEVIERDLLLAAEVMS